MDRSALALRAVAEALRLRQKLGIGTTDAVDVYGVAEQLGIDVWFIKAPTLEGMYAKGNPASILVSAERPSGRKAMTCAHEIGHHVFGHGSLIDEYYDADKSVAASEDEYLASTFAANLLMTRGAVAQAFLARGFSAQSAVAEQVYEVAGWLGVGYTALLYHMRSALRIVPRAVADQLLKIHPRDIRVQLAVQRGVVQAPGDFFLVNRNWISRPVDAHVGDTLLLAEGLQFEGRCGVQKRASVKLAAPGVGRIVGDGYAVFVRVARRLFSGLARYRHLEEIAGDDEAKVTAVDEPTRDPYNSDDRP